MLRVACDQKLGEACNNLGVMHERGAGMSVDFDAARSFYQQGCDLGDPLGCLNLGIMCRNKNEEKRALSLFEKACNGNNLRGCALLGVMLAGGEGGAKDATRASTLLKQACSGGDDSACLVLDASPELKR